MSKFLITGGAGFIGSNFCEYMTETYKNDTFICLDALTYAGNLDNLASVLLKPNFKFVKENICNRKKIFKIFAKEKFDYVINFAAESHVDRSIVHPDVFFQTNLIGTQILLEACKKYEIKRFHQISTDEVYGELPLEEKNLAFDETATLHPSSPYSASKASADLLVLAYHRTYNLPCTISRCSNNYGPNQYPEKLIPFMIKKALLNEELPIYGDGSNVRDWIYVYDHCTAIDLIVRTGKDGEIYNIGSQNEKTNLEIVQYILKVLDKPESLITFVHDRPGHDLRYAVDTKKIRELGWEPKFNFEDGILKTIHSNLEKVKRKDRGINE